MSKPSANSPSASEAHIAGLRADIDRLNSDILALIQQRAAVVLEIARRKRAQGIEGYDPRREEEMLHQLTSQGGGPFGPREVREVFKAIFRVSLDIQDKAQQDSLRVRQPGLLPPEGIRVGDVAIGVGGPVLIVGPCSVESEEQLERIAEIIVSLPGKKILRAGAYKPRTSPYAFQGLREEGLRLLLRTSQRWGIPTVTEVLDVSSLELVAEHTDMLQVGARSMYNTELLKAIGRTRKPVLLKRSFMATLEELLLSAEYIVAQGNESVVLCERGIRTFERWTRNTLDIAAVPLLKGETSLPVVVDLSHALGRRDILLPCGRAALAAGADGLMIEAHPAPDEALSDGLQQLAPAELRALVEGLGLRQEVPAT